MSKKIGCGGFRIDDDTLKLKEDGTLYAPGAGGGLPTGEAPYQQLVTDGDSNVKWEDKPWFKVNAIGVSSDNVELDATKEEIYSAFQAGKIVTVNYGGIELKGIYHEGKGMQFYGTAPEQVGTNGVMKIAVFYLAATADGWRPFMNTISTDKQ